MPKTMARAPDDGRELHEVVRDAEGKITGVLRPPTLDLSEKVLELAHGAGNREGYKAGGEVGAREG